MGSASSKTARRFPTRSPGSTVSQVIKQRAQPRPQQQQQQQQSKGEAADGVREQDNAATDPDFSPVGFASRLQRMGVVEPNPTYSPSSRAGEGYPLSSSGGDVVGGGAAFSSPSTQAGNAALSALEARRLVQERAEADAERMQSIGTAGAGRRYVDMRTLADALVLLGRGVEAGAVEERLGLEGGLLGRLGREGVLTFRGR